MTPKIRVLSLGAGVQSTCLALMAAEGAIERPDAAIFADTQAEPRALYEHLARLVPALPFPVLVVTAGSLKEHVEHGTRGHRISTPPFFTKGDLSKRGMLRRQCTRDFKIRPINRKVRELLGYRPRQRVPVGVFAEQWIGISTDEADRMKPSEEKWIRCRWPLIDLGMSREDCVRWLASRPGPSGGGGGGWKVPKSACTFCPYRSDSSWLKMKTEQPEEWAEVVAFDRSIRTGAGIKGVKDKLFLHVSRVPLDEAPLDRLGGRGGWGNECAGVCGV